MATADFSNGPIQVVEGRRRAWRKNFNVGTALSAEDWTVTQSAGMTVAIASGQLSVNMGVGINEETIIQSIASFTVPFRVQFSHAVNQRVANQEIYLEVVNAAGTTYQGWMFDGTTTTLAKTNHANRGVSVPASPTGTATVTATASTSVIREIDCRIDSIDFSDRGADSSSSATARFSHSRTALDPEEKYYIRMRFKNLGTAPTAGTINTFESILVQDTNDVLVEVGAGRGIGHGSRGIPVTIAGGNVGLSAQAVTLGASTTAGTATTIYRSVAVTAPTGLVIKATAGRVYGWTISNPGAAAAWLHFYNKATAPTVGTDTPVHSVLIPAGGTSAVEQGYGLAFATGIGIGASDAVGGATLTTAMAANVYYV